MYANCLRIDCIYLCELTGRFVNNNNNNRDDIYGAVIMAKPLREFTQFI